MSVTGKGQVSQRTSFVVLISIVAILLSAMALIRPDTVLGSLQRKQVGGVYLPDSTSADECESMHLRACLWMTNQR